MTRISITLAAILAPGVAAAHPDHFSGGHFGLAHFLTDPFHVGLAVAAVVLAVALRRSLRPRPSPTRPSPNRKA